MKLAPTKKAKKVELHPSSPLVALCTVKSLAKISAI